MKKILKYSAVLITVMLLTTGCSYKSQSTPAVMTFDGTNVDYSKVTYLKNAKVCEYFADGEGDTTIIAAAKKAKVSKVKHVDISIEHETFLFFEYGHRRCVTVYGE